MGRLAVIGSWIMALAIGGLVACGNGDATSVPIEGDPYGAILPSTEEIATFPKSLPPAALSPATPTPTATPNSVLFTETPPIGQQGPCSACTSQGSPGSCISWSAAYGLGSYTVNQSQNWGMLDPNHQVSAAYMYAYVLNKLGKTCPSGTSDPDYFNFLVKDGSVAASTVPYEANCSYLGGIDLGTILDSDFKIGSWAFVSPQDRDLVKAHLAAGQAVAFAGHLYEGFGKLEGSEVYYGSGPFETNKTTGALVGHGMLLIGYDDNLGDPSQGLGAYRIQNSFGTSWGDNGYLWMSYGTFESSILSAYVAEPAGAPINGVADLVPDSASAPTGRILLARQWARSSGPGFPRVFLIFRHQFEDAVKIGEVAVTGPDGKTARHSYQAWHRDGYTHLSRVDGKSFLPGNYSIRIETELTSGEKAAYSGEVEIGPLEPPLTESGFDEGLMGGNFKPALIP